MRISQQHNNQPTEYQFKSLEVLVMRPIYYLLLVRTKGYRNSESYQLFGTLASPCEHPENQANCTTTQQSTDRITIRKPGGLSDISNILPLARQNEGIPKLGKLSTFRLLCYFGPSTTRVLP
jgi:hypothetical protein